MNEALLKFCEGLYQAVLSLSDQIDEQKTRSDTLQRKLDEQFRDIKRLKEAAK